MRIFLLQNMLSLGVNTIVDGCTQEEFLLSLSESSVRIYDIVYLFEDPFSNFLIIDCPRRPTWVPCECYRRGRCVIYSSYRFRDCRSLRGSPSDSYNFSTGRGLY